MRRNRDFNQGTLFRGNELPRLLTLIAFMAVIGATYFRAQEPGFWRWLGTSDEPVMTAAMVRKVQDAEEPAPPTSPEYEEELAAANEEFQAITDKAPLRAEEMPSYWRLMGWQKRQTFDQLQEEARRDVTFTHLYERPEKYRGQVIHLKLRLLRSLSYPAEENDLGIERLYEAWGASDESYPSPYCIVMTDVPEEFPIGHGIEEEVEFCGYFVKVMAYSSRDDKQRGSPLLLGRMVWQKRPPAAALGKSDWTWLLLAGAAIVAVAVVRISLLLRRGVSGSQGQRKSALREPLDSEADAVPIEDWLDRAETGPENDPEHPPMADETENPAYNGNGLGRLHPESDYWRQADKD